MQLVHSFPGALSLPLSTIRVDLVLLITKVCTGDGVLPVVCTPRDGTLGFPSDAVNVPEIQA